MRMTQRGFTIVEVMFVLAAAGMILLIVFQALPALERSSRNNTRKQDVATILRAVSQYELKDTGNFPLPCGSGSVGAGSTSLNFTSSQPCDQGVAAPSYPNDAFLKGAAKNLNFYLASDVGLDPQTSAGRVSISPGATKIDKVVVLNYEKCSTTKPGEATIVGAGYSDVVALYALEASNAQANPQCQQL